MEQSEGRRTERRAAPRDTEVRFMRLKEVMALCGKSKTSVYEAMSKGEFPQVVKLGARSSAWVKCEIDDWIHACIRARRRQ